MPNAILGRQRHGIDVSVETVASVLHLRGPFTPQPLADEKGNVLLWNAEIFGGLEIEEHANDTRLLLNKLKECSDHTDIADFMSRIYGPWSFIYYQVKNQLLWFGRDFFGRRSLLWHLPHHALDSFSLSSVATKTGKQTVWSIIPMLLVISKQLKICDVILLSIIGLGRNPHWSLLSQFVISCFRATSYHLLQLEL
jgi:hypothetical protein